MKKSVEMFEVIFSTAINDKLLEPLKVSKIGFVVDSDEKTVRMAEVVRDIAKNLGSKIVVIYPPGTDLSTFIDILSPYVETVESMESEKPYSAQISEIAANYSLDLIAITMPYPKREEAVRGGTIEALMKDLKRPLLIGNEPVSIERVGLLIYPNPLSEKPIRRATTLAKSRLDIISIEVDEVREGYFEQLEELFSKKYECEIIKIKSPAEVDHDLVIYELSNVHSPITLRKTFLIV